jgi:hypothetical protein
VFYGPCSTEKVVGVFVRFFVPLQNPVIEQQQIIMKTYFRAKKSRRTKKDFMET